MVIAVLHVDIILIAVVPTIIPRDNMEVNTSYVMKTQLKQNLPGLLVM